MLLCLFSKVIIPPCDIIVACVDNFDNNERKIEEGLSENFGVLTEIALSTKLLCSIYDCFISLYQFVMHFVLSLICMPL